ncbi:MAG: protein kinase [Gemmataceae bacterium]
MPPPASTDEFLDLVGRSGVVEESKLRNWTQKQTEAATLPPDPQKLAGAMVRDGLLTYFQAEQLLQGKYKRFTIGKYKVLEKLGAGGMAQVFLCEHKLMRRRVAIKVLPTAKADDPSSLERFYREARAVAAVDHPNIVRAYDIDQDENLHFLVMEFVDGTNLQDLVKKFGPLDPLRACHYIYASAVGLQHAHEMTLIHRDIKPGNILLDRNGVVKILDMGLARFFYDDQDDVTKKYDENVLGTADYLAPEQALDSHTVDIRADIYSLGATFYFLLTGSPVFPEGSVAQKLIWHQNRQPKPISAFRADVPAEVCAIIDKMMAKKPEARYQTPAEVMAALAPWVATPIPPPAEREMPQLSVAASLGVKPTPASTAGTIPRLPTPSMASMPALPNPSGFSHPAPAPVAPVQAPASAPADNGSPAVWGEIDTPSASTRQTAHDSPTPMKRSGRLNPPSRSGTKAPAARPNRTGSRVGRAPVPVEEPGGKKKFLLAGVALLAFLGIAVGLYFAFSGGGSVATNTGPTEDDGKLVFVDNETTLSQALTKVQAGGKIHIKSAKITTPGLSLKRKEHKDITIEGPEGKPAIIEVQGSPEAMLNLSSVEGVRLKNLDFEGMGRANYGVVVNGSCPGFVMEGCSIKGTKLACVRFYNASGGDKQLLVDRCRFHMNPNQTGILIEAIATGQNDTRRLTIRNSRFEGAPGGHAGKGIRIDSATTELELTGNRFFNTEAAFAFSRPPANKTVKAQIVSNTVYEARVGLEFDMGGGGQSGNYDLSVRQNYFAKTRDCMQGNGQLPPGNNLPGIAPDTNGQGPNSNPGNLKELGLIRVDNPQLADPDLNNDATFLRFPGGPPEANGKKVGAP